MHKGFYLFVFLFTALAIGSCSYYEYQEDIHTSPEQTQKQPLQKEIHPVEEAPDFSAIHSVKKRKLAFLNYLRPGIDYENQRIAVERTFLQEMKQMVDQDLALSQGDVARLNKIALSYKIESPGELPESEWFVKALRRVDILPEALVFIQAANESAWGTSRFAREGNNYFGQWCYRQGCGLVPLARNEGATHEVARFHSVQQSIHRYFMNVNRNKAYQVLRNIRSDLRNQGMNLASMESAVELTNGLAKYSERGEEYVNSLKAMIRHNKGILNSVESG